MKKTGLKSEQIYQAAQVLNLGEKETMTKIKKSYRDLIQKWHPDKCKDNQEKCKTKTEEIVNAYKLIINYCNNYRYSFKKEDIVNNLPVKEQIQENFKKRFGNDPLWSNNSDNKKEG